MVVGTRLARADKVGLHPNSSKTSTGPACKNNKDTDDAVGVDPVAEKENTVDVAVAVALAVVVVG